MHTSSEIIDNIFNISSKLIGVITAIGVVCMCILLCNSSMSVWIIGLICVLSPIIWLISFYVLCFVFALVLIGVAGYFDRSIWRDYLGGDVL